MVETIWWQVLKYSGRVKRLKVKSVGKSGRWLSAETWYGPLERYAVDCATYACFDSYDKARAYAIERTQKRMRDAFDEHKSAQARYELAMALPITAAAFEGEKGNG